MKKILAVLMAIALSLTFFAFVGCDEEPKDPGTVIPGNPDDGEETPGTSKDGKVTKDEWNAALSMESFTNYTMSGSMSSDGGFQSDLVKLKTEGTDILIYTQTTTDDVVSEAYFKDTGDVVYGYTKIGDEWYCEENNYFSAESIYMYCSYFYDQYDLFTYDESKGAYTAEECPSNIPDASQTFIDCVLKFEDKKLVLAEYTIKEENIHLKLQYSDYGNTQVTLPQVVENEKMPQTEWENAFNDEFFKNYTVNIQTIQDGYYTKTGQKWYQVQDSGYAAYTDGSTDIRRQWLMVDNSLFSEEYSNKKEDGTYELYSYNRSEQKYEVFDDDYKIEPRAIMSFKNLYAQARPTSKENVYILNNAKINVPGWNIIYDTVTLTFDNEGKIIGFTAIKKDFVNLDKTITLTCEATVSYEPADITLPQI